MKRIHIVLRLFFIFVVLSAFVFIAPGEAQKPKVIKVGGIFDMTGGTSDVGKEYAQGAIDAARYINEHGGVHGIPIELLANDYGYKIPEAVKTYKNLRDAHNVQIIQGWGTGDTEALSKTINEDKVVYMSASYSSHLNDPSKTPYNFFVGTSYSDAIRMAMKYVKETITEHFPEAKGRRPRVVFIYPDVGYGRAPIPAGKAFAQELGIDIGPDQNVALTALDATSQLLSMKGFDPDWAWVGGTTMSTATILKDAAKLGLRTKFIINNWGFDENLPKLAGPAADERAYGMVPFAFWGENVPGMKPIMEAHRKYHPNDKHTIRYVQGWTTMMVMWAALKRVKGDYTGPNIKAALETLRNFDTGGLCAPITFTPDDHRPNVKEKIYKVSKGKLVFVKDVEIAREKRFLGW